MKVLVAGATGDHPSWRQGFAEAADAARPAGFEPAASASGGQRSIH
jgi:hypothetical protein